MSKYTVYTIEEIQAQAERLGMPLAKMRFFPGENRADPKCFGIYADIDGNFIVYKNKADGTRAVRYRGRSEAEACEIFWDKIEEEVRKRQKDRDWWKHQQQLASDPEYASEFEKEMTRRAVRRSTPAPASSRNRLTTFLPLMILPFILAGFMLLTNRPAVSHPHTGYYTTPQQEIYYYDHGDWYGWNDGAWHEYDDFDYNTWSSWGYDGSHVPSTADDTSFYEFSDSEYYKDTYYDDNDSYDYDDTYDSDWSDDWDDYWDSSDDYDYDWSDWDTSDTDWDSDW